MIPVVFVSTDIQYLLYPVTLLPVFFFEWGLRD